MTDEPATKKLKSDKDEEKIHDIVECISEIQNSNKNLTVVLSDDFNNTTPLINMFAGLVRSSKEISKAIRVLNEKVPLKELNHLKRVRNNLILVCPSNNLKDISMEDFIKSNVPELINTFEKFIEVPVPMYAPKLKRQHTELNKIWSCNFHPDAYLEKLNSDNFFSSKDLKLHRLYMSLAFVAKGDLNKNNNVCVVVNPNIDSVVAVAIDNSSNHPIQHSAMVAIDNVAKTQFGGAWDCKEIKNSNCSFKGIDEKLLDHLKKKFPDIKFGAKEFKTKEDLQQEDKTNADGPYLCTNYYVYMLREPCLMCAMALVHARVKRLFYCFDNPINGALKSRAKLHTVSSLNHHYEVFTGFL